MKKIFLLFCVIALFSGCTKGCQKQLKHIKSDFTGLRRQVTLFNYDGKPIKSWTGNLQIEMKESGIMAWIGDNGKEVKVFGGIVIVEEE